MKKQFTLSITALFALINPLFCEEVLPENPIIEEVPKKVDETLTANVELPTAAAVPEFVLSVDQKKGAVIEELITTMGTSSVLGLGFKKNHLRSLGKQLDGLGALHFLGYIFSRADLKKHMVAIHTSPLKWGGFMDGIKPGLTREANSKELFEKLPGFATMVKVDHEPLKQMAEKQDWEGFVAFLVKN